MFISLFCIILNLIYASLIFLGGINLIDIWHTQPSFILKIFFILTYIIVICNIYFFCQTIETSKKVEILSKKIIQLEDSIEKDKPKK